MIQFKISQELLDSLLASTRTPFYVYSKGVLEKTIEEIRNAFPKEKFQLLFATMANDNEEFLRFIAAHGVGACVNSIVHLDKVIKCGIDVTDIQFTSTGIPENEMKILSGHKVAVNVDSIPQLQQWFTVNPGGNAGIRINTGSLAPELGSSDRLGIAKDELKLALKMADQLGGKINGLHIYVGTDYKDHQKMLIPIARLFELSATVPSIEYLNIGGGAGVQYMGDANDFNLSAFGATVSVLRSDFEHKHNKAIKLIFEPGRRMAAGSGIFITKVTDIKKLGETRYVVVDASVSVFPRPLHQPYSPHNITSFVKGEIEETVIVGKTTFSKDILGRVLLSSDVEVGSPIIFEQAGAYCDSMRSKFLGQYEPSNLFV